MVARWGMWRLGSSAAVGMWLHPHGVGWCAGEGRLGGGQCGVTMTGDEGAVGESLAR